MRWIEKAFLVLSSAILIAVACVIFSDVIARYVFNKPFGGAFELVAIGIALMTFAALPEATARNVHISVSLVKTLPQGVQNVLRVAMAVLVSGSLAILGWRLFEHAMRLNAFGDYAMFTGIPYAPVAGIMAASCMVTALFRAIRIVLTPLQDGVVVAEDQQ